MNHADPIPVLFLSHLLAGQAPADPAILYGMLRHVSVLKYGQGCARRQGRIAILRQCRTTALSLGPISMIGIRSPGMGGYHAPDSASIVAAYRMRPTQFFRSSENVGIHRVSVHHGAASDGCRSLG